MPLVVAGKLPVIFVALALERSGPLTIVSVLGSPYVSVAQEPFALWFAPSVAARPFGSLWKPRFFSPPS
jgi:hypothetical protein